MTLDPRELTVFNDTPHAAVEQELREMWGDSSPLDDAYFDDLDDQDFRPRSRRTVE